MSKEINLLQIESEENKEFNQTPLKKDLSSQGNKSLQENTPEKQTWWNQEDKFIKIRKAKSIIEALLFATNQPITLNKIREVLEDLFPFKPKEIKQMLSEIQYDYKTQGRGFQLSEIAEGYILRSDPQYSPYIHLLKANKRLEKLSSAALETLACIAYKQPITRAGIESIRGVDSSGIIHTLLERELIEGVGKQNSPGRPTLYGTSRHFLQYFGMNEVQEITNLKPVIAG